jgi:hypothetical protein
MSPTKLIALIMLIPLLGGIVAFVYLKWRNKRYPSNIDILAKYQMVIAFFVMFLLVYVPIIIILLIFGK